MLTIVIPETEIFDDNTQSFMSTKQQTIVLEHSLISLSKWEAKWKKPFLSTKDSRSPKEILDYIKCMTITPNVPDDTYTLLASHSGLMKKIVEYINDSQTATTFNDKNQQKRTSQQVVTSELIYYWMIQLNIPVEFQKWHLSRLLTLIRICEIKNGKPNKMPRNAIYNRNRALNAQRKARLGTRG